MFIAAYSQQPESMKQLECPLSDKWMNKMWYVNTMKYHSVIRSNETFIYATTWVNTVNIM